MVVCQATSCYNAAMRSLTIRLSELEHYQLQVAAAHRALSGGAWAKQVLLLAAKEASRQRAEGRRSAQEARDQGPG